LQLKSLEAELNQLKERWVALGGFKAAQGTLRTAADRGRIIAVGFLTRGVFAYPRLQENADVVEQMTVRNVPLALALAAFQRDHARYPDKLDELVPAYLPSIPGDIFSGKLLTYRPSENGYLLYSVGRNGADDGGRTQDDHPQGDDIVVRMPLPEPRRRL
jgi:hypothetical protein